MIDKALQSDDVERLGQSYFFREHGLPLLNKIIKAHTSAA